MSNYHDLVIEELSDSEAELRERLASVEADLETYRALAQQAIHALHDLTRSHERLREQHHRLLDEYRTLREKTMREAIAA